MEVRSVYLIILMLSATFPAAGIADERGGIHGGGADQGRLARYVNLDVSKQDPRAHYKNSFVSSTLAGLAELEALAWIQEPIQGPDGQSKVLTIEQVRKARDLVFAFAANEDPQKFVLDENLEDPETKKPRMAENLPGSYFKLNPLEWGKKLDEEQSSDRAQRIRMSVGVHEFFSQPEIGLEGTGHFFFSSVLLKEVPLEQGKQTYQKLLSALFAPESPSLFYSCDLNLYRNQNGSKVKVWQSPIPIRTYLQWSLFPGHNDSMDGHPIIVNPNFIPGATSGCIENALEANGMISPIPVRNDYLKFMYKMPDRTHYLDVCYVIGDPLTAPPEKYDGDARFMIRLLDSSDKHGWAKFNYVTPETKISGKGSTVLKYQDLDLEISCGRLAPYAPNVLNRGGRK